MNNKKLICNYIHRRWIVFKEFEIGNYRATAREYEKYAKVSARQLLETLCNNNILYNILIYKNYKNT